MKEIILDYRSEKNLEQDEPLLEAAENYLNGIWYFTICYHFILSPLCSRYYKSIYKSKMRVVQKKFFSMMTKSVFNKVDVKVDNKIGFIHLNSDKDLNALSAEMRAAIVSNVKDF